MAAYPTSIRKKILKGVTAYFIVSASLLIFLYVLLRGSSLSSVVLIVSLIFLGISGIIIFQILLRAALKPVKEIEENLKMIAGGQFKPVYLDFDDAEIKALNDSLKKMMLYLSHEHEIRQKQLMHTEKLASLGTFLSGIAHELVNPLSNIYSSSQILIEEIDDVDREYQKELLTQIEQESDRARKTARSLLEFSRDSDAKKEMLSLKILIEETIRFVSGQKPSGIDVVVQIPDYIRIYAGKQRIQQAFLNLIKNAIEAIYSEGTVTITAKDDEEEGFVNIEVHDTGPGINPELLPKIFDAFFTTKEIGKGSGLGLFITHEIIKENNGSIHVASQDKMGTTFLVKLPSREF